MKLSVETKVAAAVAAGFIALTAGTIALGRSGDQAGGPNDYGLTNSPGVNANMSQQGLNSASAGRANAEEGTQRLRDASATSMTQKKGTKHKSGKPSKHRTQRTQQNQGTTTGY
jgi:hypothetical protein